MAEFCLECWNSMNEREEDSRQYILSEELELCEGCGEWKHVIIGERGIGSFYNLKYLLFVFQIICRLVRFLCRLMMLPCFIYKNIKKRN